jgi:WD40 repeat protein
MLVMDLGRKVTVGHLAFAPDGRALAAASDRGVSLWRTIADGARADPVRGPYPSGGVRFTADGRHLFTGAYELWRVEPETGASAVLPLWGGYGTTFDVSPTGPYVLVAQSLGTGGDYRTRVALWRADDLYLTGKLWEQDLLGLNALPPRFVTAGDRFARLDWARTRPGGPFAYRATFYDTATGAPHAATTVPVHYPYEWLPSPDGTRLAVRGTVQVDVFRLDAPDAGPLRFRNDSKRHFTGMAFHPAGRFLAAVSNDHTAKLFDTATGETRTFTWNLGRLRSVCFSRDGTLAAAGTDKGQAVVWDVDA